MQNSSHRTKRVREELGLNISMFAKRMDYDRNYVSQVEKGVREPGPRFLKQLTVLEREAGLVGKFSEPPEEETHVGEEEGNYGSPARESRHLSDRLLAEIVDELLAARGLSADERLRMVQPYQQELSRRMRHRSTKHNDRRDPTQY